MAKPNEFNVIIERDSEGYFVVSVPKLKRCHTQAKSLDILMKLVREAIELRTDVQEKSVDRPDFLGVQRIAV